jgi:hypothetical protein
MKMDRSLGSLYSPIPKNHIKYEGSVYEHRVRPRDEKRVLVEVDVFPSNGTGIGGQHVKQGKHRVVLYQSDLEDLEAATASPQQIRDWDDAVASYEAQRERWVVGAVGKNDGSEQYRIKRERALAQYGDTTPSLEFCRKHPLGRPPVTSWRVLAENLDAPDTDSNRESKRLEHLIGQLVDGLGKAVSQKQTSRNGG